MKIRILLVVFLSFCLVDVVSATRLIFSNEVAQTDSSGRLVIDQQDYENDVELKFGGSIDASILFDRLNDKFSINRNVDFNGNEVVNFQVEGLAVAPTCDDNQSGRIYFNAVTKSSYSCNGQIWRQIDAGTSAMAPYVDAGNVSIQSSSSAVLSITGNFFSTNSVLSIPGFDGTINGVAVVSPTQIDLNLTAGSTLSSYSVVVENNGNFNTEWSGNGVGKIVVVAAGNGLANNAPGISCNDLLTSGFSVGDGLYWIDPNEGDASDSFQVFCDMTTNGGGWTRVDYAADLSHQAQFGGGDANRWLPNNFTFALSNTQIDSIRSVSTTAKQKYVGSCQGVIHYLYQTNNYAYAFGFRFMDGHETAFGQQTYPTTNIAVSGDGCVVNNNTMSSTTFDIQDIRLPLVNIHSRDNSSTEQFGSLLTQNPAWFK